MDYMRFHIIRWVSSNSSAGSPTETLLQLLFLINDSVPSLCEAIHHALAAGDGREESRLGPSKVCFRHWVRRSTYTCTFGDQLHNLFEIYTHTHTHFK